MIIVKRIYILVLWALPLWMVVVFSSCQKDDDPAGISDNDTIPTGNIIDTLTGLGHEESGDYTWDEQSEIPVTLNGGSITSGSPKVQVDGTTATINAEGNYRISGSLTSGSIIVDAGEDALVRLILENVTVHNPSGPAILIEKAGKVLINIPQNTVNHLSDGPSYSLPDEDPNATLFSKADLTLFGSGMLTIDGEFKDGITGKDGLIIKSGTYTVHAADDAIRGKNYLLVQDANISVEAGGDGFKSDELTNPKPGNIVFEGSVINAVTGGDGISAEGGIGVNKGYYNILAGGGSETDTSSVSQKGFKAGISVFLAPDSIYVDAADHDIDSDGTIEVRSGTFDLNSARTGIHSNEEIIVSGGSININRATEGFESKTIDINAGNIRINSIDDCFSATAGYDVELDDESSVRISGGYLVLDCLNGDGIDSNGDILITDGTIIIHGPRSEPEVAIDVNGEFNLNGGFLIGSGTDSDLIEYPDSTSLQSSLMAIFAENYPQETIFHITNNMDESLVTFKPTDQFQSVIFSSPDLVKNGTYKIYVEGTVNGQDNDGLLEGDYTPGVFITEFTISEQVTVLTDLKSDPGIQ